MEPTEATYEARYEDVVAYQNSLESKCEPNRKVEPRYDSMIEGNLPPSLYWVVTKQSGEKMIRHRDYSPMTKKERNLYSSDHFTPRLPVKSHNKYTTYPPFYFEYRHQYRMQEKRREEGRLSWGPQQHPIEVPLDVAFGPNHKRAKYDDDIESPRSKRDYEKIRDKNPRDRALRSNETYLGDDDNGISGPADFRVPWCDNSDARSTRSNQSWPVKKRDSQSQERRDLGFFAVCRDDKPDVHPGSGAPRASRSRWGRDKQKRGSSDSSNDKTNKSAKTESSSSIAVNHKSGDNTNAGMLAEASRLLAEMKLKNEFLSQQMEAKRKFEVKVAALEAINREHKFPHYIECMEAVKGVHYNEDRHYVLVPATMGRLARRPEYDPAKDYSFEWLSCSKDTEALLKRI